MQNAPEKRRALSNGALLSLGFLAVILVGSVLLSLPVACAGGRLSPMEALFTATSAVCVTGLSVIDVTVRLTAFGQGVLLALIQVGGLGFLVFTTVLFAALGRRLSLKNRLVIQESMNAGHLSGLMRLMQWVFSLTLIAETAGAALLSLRFVPLYGWGRGVYFSVFHSVSAFCNAGIDLLGGAGVAAFQGDYLVLGTLMLLSIAGGLGFPVISDLLRNRRFSRLEVQTRLVLIMSGGLILVGWALVAALEWTNPGTLGGMGDVGERALNALFQSVTLRSAGFASFPQAAMRPATKLLSTLFMFIGTAPASTGGGVKLTTVAALMLLVRAIAQGREQVTLFRHTIPRRTTEQAACVLLIAFAIVLVDMLLLCAAEPNRVFSDVMYEAAAAFTTVGLSCGITGGLSPAGRLIVIITMFAGRVGPLTLALALSRRAPSVHDKLHYPEANIMIG